MHFDLHESASASVSVSGLEIGGSQSFEVRAVKTRSSSEIGTATDTAPALTSKYRRAFGMLPGSNAPLGWVSSAPPPRRIDMALEDHLRI